MGTSKKSSAGDTYNVENQVQRNLKKKNTHENCKHPYKISF